MQSKLEEEMLKAIGGIQILTSANIMFSSLIYRDASNRHFIINKAPNAPSFYEDWRMYSTMRACAKTFIVTGKILRDQAEISCYRPNKYPFSCFEDVSKLQQSNKKQKVIVLTNHLDDQFLDTVIDSSLYEPYLTDRLGLQTKCQLIPHQQTFAQYLDYVYKQMPKPILLECGSQTLIEYFGQSTALLDTIIITVFEGDLEEQFKGLQFPNDYLKTHQEIFVSEWYQHPKGRFRMHVYRSK